MFISFRLERKQQSIYHLLAVCVIKKCCSITDSHSCPLRFFIRYCFSVCVFLFFIRCPNGCQWSIAQIKLDKLKIKAQKKKTRHNNTELYDRCISDKSTNTRSRDINGRLQSKCPIKIRNKNRSNNNKIREGNCDLYFLYFKVYGGRCFVFFFVRVCVVLLFISMFVLCH